MLFKYSASKVYCSGVIRPASSSLPSPMSPPRPTVKLVAARDVATAAADSAAKSFITEAAEHAEQAAAAAAAASAAAEVAAEGTAAANADCEHARDA